MQEYSLTLIDSTVPSPRETVFRLALFAAALAFCTDWVTKSWAMQTLDSAMPLGALVLRVARNNAFAFSAGEGEIARDLVIVVRLLGMSALWWVAWRFMQENPRHAIGLGLVLGGGCGNAADLLFRRDGVVDFIGAGPFVLGGGSDAVRFHLVFNAADLAVLVGIGLLAPLIRYLALSAQRRLIAWESSWRAA